MSAVAVGEGDVGDGVVGDDFVLDVAEVGRDLEGCGVVVAPTRLDGEVDGEVGRLED